MILGRIVIHYAPISLASRHTHIVPETSVLGRLSKTAVSAIGAIATKAHLVRQADHCAPRDEGGFQCLAVTDCLQRDPIGIGQNGFGGGGAFERIGLDKPEHSLTARVEREGVGGGGHADFGEFRQ